MKEQTLREAFEAYMKNNRGADDSVIKRIGDDYMYANIHMMWEVWQAAASWADK